MRTKHPLILVCIAVTPLCACGPLSHPMFDRLPPGAQAQVNTEWNNMLSSPNRLDRETLLEVIAESRLFETGVTRGAFHAEKTIATGTVVMDITFDEPNPANDRFEIRIYDLAWNLLRAETFQREDVVAAETKLTRMNQYLADSTTQPATQKWILVPDTAPATGMSPDDLIAWMASHQAAVALRQKLDAATQPATTGPKP